MMKMTKFFSQRNYSFWLVLYMALKPIYIFKSGFLQISDMVLLLAIGIDFYSSCCRQALVEKDLQNVFLGLWLLVLFQTVVNGIWYIFYPDSGLLVSCLFYIFNAAAFFYFISVERKKGTDYFRRSIAYGIMISVCVTLLGIVLDSGSSRATGFFNNPNQLGLYGLLILTLLFLVSEYFKPIMRCFVVISTVIIVIVSASKAAFIGIICLLFLYVIFVEKNTSTWSLIKKILLLTIVAGAVYAFFFSKAYFIVSNDSLMFMRDRMMNMAQESDSNLITGRGYGRIAEMGMHIFWGMGEGAYERFTIMPHKEVHSLFASLVVSYGLIGFVWYVFFFRTVIQNKGKTIRNLAVMSGFFLYSFTHNSIRNTLFWMVLAILLLEKKACGQDNDSFPRELN